MWTIHLTAVSINIRSVSIQIPPQNHQSSQPIIPAANTIIAGMTPTAYPSPPSVFTSPSIESSSSAATTAADPTKLRN